MVAANRERSALCGQALALLLLMATAATACKGDDKTAKPAATTPSRPRPWDTTFTAARLGPLTASTAVDRATLGSLFPGAEVKRRIDRSEGDEFEVFDVTRDGDAVFRVYPAAGIVSAVDVYAAEFRLDGEVAVGDRFEDLRKVRGPVECFGGAEENAGRAFCSRKTEPGLVFVFPLHDPKHELYAAALTGDKLAAVEGQTIEYIIWTPAANVEPEPEPEPKTDPESDNDGVE